MLILRTYGPYLSTLGIATIRKLFAARTTLAECSALVVRNCHAAQLGRVYGPRSCNSNKLGAAAVPTLGTNAITLPHLAREWTGPGKDMILAQTQAAYYGAYMVYSRNIASSFLESPNPDSHVYVYTFTTDGTLLNTYAYYSSQSPSQVKYHQYPTSTSLLRSSYEDFKTARRRLRNVQD